MDALPAVVPERGLPFSVTVYEVGPRDGLQAEQGILDAATKAALIGRLGAAGLTVIEATAFVSPKWIPQLADAAEVFARLDPAAGIRYPVLVPNLRGLERAVAAGAREIAVFASATETFARNNLNRGARDVLAQLAPVLAEAGRTGVAVRGYVSMCFGDPWEGEVPFARVVETVTWLLDHGCGRVSLGDTIGTGTPGHVRGLIDALGAAGVEPSSLAGHFHDTYGQALANVHAALQAGVAEFDSSVGGLGGCPYAASATGNLATEDLVWMLHGLGYDTGVDLTALVRTSTWISDRLRRPNASRAATALSRRAGAGAN
ncbi:hydroxymethylglutaryl-CoA lyase [Streptomyces nanshensis]|uniref:Hydroxymethylglutaryl-CoA lyase n=1 Tax=Streptomyces nanshensis TaxID=518642 RepID=A0A1E7L3L4_9ACTN|nr:hydroxymethylglutaryl-CoA lyase [Streptomyces nanshensis]OEV10779.1 hydroxymethylglutaryl-CoA lyase [Streptomyces nanshensis]